MVKGLDSFWKYFADYEEQYVLIGGAACDMRTILCKNKPGYARKQKFTKAHKARDTKKN